MPVTNGLKGKMNPRQKGKFYEAGKKREPAWWLGPYQTAKKILFSVGALMLARFLLRGPSKDDEEEFEEFDDEKFFEEYGAFYSSTETEEENDDDLYDDMF